MMRERGTSSMGALRLPSSADDSSSSSSLSSGSSADPRVVSRVAPLKHGDLPLFPGTFPNAAAITFCSRPVARDPTVSTNWAPGRRAAACSSSATPGAARTVPRARFPRFPRLRPTLATLVMLLRWLDALVRRDRPLGVQGKSDGALSPEGDGMAMWPTLLRPGMGEGRGASFSSSIRVPLQAMARRMASLVAAQRKRTGSWRLESGARSVSERRMSSWRIAIMLRWALRKHFSHHSSPGKQSGWHTAA
mmetsp:Transcript_58893/g.135892  ORF Transcript_58893/g.135892 Transcript_58893/m.135892 type:complete len:249 (+) Transcript_58893:400-1146(+)